jgi:hypothetical protein
MFVLELDDGDGVTVLGGLELPCCVVAGAGTGKPPEVDELAVTVISCELTEVIVVLLTEGAFVNVGIDKV